MFKVEQITKDWKEAGSLQAHINLYGFWDENAFFTKSGDLGAVLRIGGIDYESLDRARRDYAVKRLEAAFRSLDDRTRLYQILFKHNRPAIRHEDYQNPLVSAAVEQRAAFLQSKADRLYGIEIFWVVMVDGNYTQSGLLHALSQLAKGPRRAVRELNAMLAGNRQRTLLFEQINRDRMHLQQKIRSLTGQLNDLMQVELLGAEKTFRLVRRLVNFRPFKTQEARLHGPRFLDWQLCDSELEAHRGYLRMDDDYLRVLTMKEMPSTTHPLLLNGLLDIPANFHVVSEWHPVDSAVARKEINKRRRHYHNSKTSFLSNLQDQQNAGPRDELVDDSKEAAVAELGDALTAIGMEGKSFGEFTFSVVIYDEDRAKVEHAIAEFQKLFTTHDGLLYEERYNLLNAFFATVPGNRQFNLRKQWTLNSNYADLSLLFTVDSGKQWNAHLEREYLAVLESTHGTPYYLNLHFGDVAHTLVLGATGSGKSFTLNFLIQSLQKYEPLTFIFDLGGSYETLTRGFGGTYLNVGLKNPGFTINPFSLELNRTIRDWITRAEKTWRKKNAAMILATQSVVELQASEMLHVVNESCPTKVFLANLRVRLDFELKSQIQKAIYAARKADPEREMNEIKQQVAQQFDLPFVNDGIQIPDARIEYDLDQGSRTGHEDIEVLTAAYRPGHLRNKAQAGFHVYASASDRATLTARAENDHHLLDQILEL